MKRISAFALTLIAVVIISTSAMAIVPPIVSLSLDRSEITLARGDARRIIATVKPSERRGEIVTWSSSDAQVARVEDGDVIAVGVGTAVITSQVGPIGNRFTAKCRVRVLPASKAVEKAVRARFIKLNYSLKALSFNRELQLVATVLPATCPDSDKIVTWSSSNPDIASVDNNGLVKTFDMGGTVIIKAMTGNGKIAKCKLVVKTVPVKTVTLDSESLTIEKGSSATLTATLKPVGATDMSVVWKSDNEDVARVTDGKVTAVSSGITTVQAISSSGVKDTCKIIVPGETVSVSIVAGGDVTMGGDPRRASSQDASEQHYAQLYSKFSGEMLGAIDDEFKQSNTVSVINLECCFTNASVTSNKTYILRAKPAYAQSLVKAGIDVVNHSNNHMLDFGTVGLANTKQVVRQNGMKYVGNSITAVVEENGVTIGFCGFNPTGGSVASLASAVIKKLNKTCDIVVASFHWGTDFKYAASAEQRSLGRAAVKAGADLVLGHHPHVVSGVEKYRGKYIVYSLGTLSSALLTPNDMDTMLIRQTFNVDPGTGIVTDGGTEIIPLSMSSESKNNAHPVKLTGSNRTRVLNKVKKYSAGFSETLPDSCFN